MNKMRENQFMGDPINSTIKFVLWINRAQKIKIIEIFLKDKCLGCVGLASEQKSK